MSQQTFDVTLEQKDVRAHVEPVDAAVDADEQAADTRKLGRPV